MSKYVNNKTVIIAIVAVGAVAAIVAAATLIGPASAFGPRGFWAHGGHRGDFGPGHMYGGMMSENANWTGSVSVESVKADVIESVKSKVNVTVSEVESAAKQAIGEGSEVCCVTLAPVNGYIVYVAHGIDSSNTPHRVIVDAGNGQVLDSAQVEMGMHGSFGPWGAHESSDGMWQGQ
jgi:hypothetical protein